MNLSTNDSAVDNLFTSGGGTGWLVSLFSDISSSFVSSLSNKLKSANTIGYSLFGVTKFSGGRFGAGIVVFSNA